MVARRSQRRARIDARFNASRIDAEANARAGARIDARLVLRSTLTITVNHSRCDGLKRPNLLQYNYDSTNLLHQLKSLQNQTKGKVKAGTRARVDVDMFPCFANVLWLEEYECQAMDQLGQWLNRIPV